MRLKYPRLIGLLGLLWMPILRKGLLAWESDAEWISYTFLWLTASLMLAGGRNVRQAGALLSALALYAVAWRAEQLVDALAMFAWVGLILTVTEGRPHERALLVRVLVSTVYGFAAIAKLNPSFLGGEQLVGVVLSRNRFEELLPFLRSDWGVAVSIVVVAAEGWMAIGLWLPKFRMPTIALGLILHPSLIVFATYGSLEDICFITVLNAMLIAGYLAFFEPIRAEQQTGSAQPATL